MPKVLISGGAGFLGSHLCDYFIARDFDVIAVDSLVTGRRDNVAHLASHPRFTLIEHDVSTPYDYPAELDYILHMASPASPPDYTAKPFVTLRAGSYAAHELLEVARSRHARFLLASTSEIYGDPPAEHHPQVETYWGNVNPNGPRSVYDEAKRYAEAVTMAYHREYGVETRIVRIFNTYGPRMRANDGRVVTNLVSQALQGRPLTLYGDGTQTRSFCYVSDLIDGICKLLMSDELGPVNIGNPIEFTMHELARLILELTGSISEIVTIPFPFEDDPKQRRPDISKAKRTLNWEPRVPLKDGLKTTIDYLRKELKN
jgi:dTDP-glucose 4,6-dehydratase